MNPAQNLLQDYLAALTSKRIEEIEKLTAATTVVEIPFLKPTRLIGKAEITKAHLQIFANLDSIKFEIDNCETSPNHAIASGRLAVVREITGQQDFQAGIVSEVGTGGAQRISLYCDARNVRPWSDKTIL